MPLANSKIAPRLPAQDLDRARAFYAEKLGLEPVDERPGGFLYRVSGGPEFAVFASSGRASGDHTQMAFEVDDLDAAVAEMRRRGVEFTSEIVDIEGNYPSKGARGERATWFYDSEGNVLGIGQLVY
jgi:catechol 2,3-dioxygenase-like lactoylglutathione lyase family enzyme